MSWASSIFIGLITAVVGTIAGGIVAGLAVRWYRISSFEAGSAGFIVGIAFLGLVAGLVIGLVTSRVVSAGASPGFLKALGLSQGIVLSIAAVSAIAARLFADVRPTIDGVELMLAVEVRWPEGTAESPSTLGGTPFIRLSSVTRGSHTVRKSSRGPLWTADARLVDGRWVAPGAVDLFTSRGRLVLEAVLNDSTTHGVLIPLSGSPGRKDLEWSAWYPQARPGAPPLPNGFTYRYRVQRRTDPVRTDTIGPFEVTTVAGYFYDEGIGDRSKLAAMSEFTVKHRGEPVVLDARTSLHDSSTARLTTADGVATVAGPRPALLVHFIHNSTGGACYLLVDEESGRLRTEFVPNCPLWFGGSPLTADNTAFHAARGHREPRGWINRSMFAAPGLFLLENTVLDTRDLSVRYTDEPDDVSLNPNVPPLGVSPDERSFVRYATTDDAEAKPLLVVTDAVANQSYIRAIDPARMRFSNYDALDPAWVQHHFTWKRGADGIDRLVERTDFVPIPYHGRLVVERNFRAYWLEPAREKLRTAVLDFLVDEMGAERLPVDSGAYEYPVRLNGETVNVAWGSTPGYVSVTLDDGSADMTLLQTIARRFDAALATGKYDSMFGK